MARIRATKFTALAWLSPVVVLFVILAACGGRLSEFDAVQGDLQAAQTRVKALESAVQELQAKLTVGVVEDIGTLLNISQLMAFPPTIVELNLDSPGLQMTTKVPTKCSIMYGPDYGQISTDHFGMDEGHTDHNHVLEGLEPHTA